MIADNKKRNGKAFTNRVEYEIMEIMTPEIFNDFMNRSSAAITNHKHLISLILKIEYIFTNDFEFTRHTQEYKKLLMVILLIHCSVFISNQISTNPKIELIIPLFQQPINQETHDIKGKLVVGHASQMGYKLKGSSRIEKKPLVSGIFLNEYDPSYSQ